MSAHFLSHEDFEPHTGSRFTLIDPVTSPTALDLIEVQPLKSYLDSHRARTPFSLLFKSHDPQILPQHLYRMEHDSMGELAIFLVPIGRDASGVTYEAAFN